MSEPSSSRSPDALAPPRWPRPARALVRARPSLPARRTLASSLVAHGSWLIALTALGLLLRRYRLGAQGLWFDEADLAARARAPLAELLAAFLRPGENGPLYGLLMAAWVRLAGDGELTLRLPSMLAGALAVPALALLGRALGGWRIGLLAAGLLAISPYAVWYSQDAKMYALLTLLTPATWLALLAALRRDRPGWWLAYAALTAVSFGVHVVSGLVWLSQVLVVLLGWRRLGPARRGWRRTTLALLLPVLAIGLWRARYLLSDDLLGSWQPPVTLPEMLAILAVKLAVNRADPATEQWGALLYAALAALGLTAWLRRGAGEQGGRPHPGPLPQRGRGNRGWSGEAAVVAPAQPALPGSAPSPAARERAGGEGGSPAPPLPCSPALLLLGALLAPIAGFALLTLRVPLFQDRYLIVVLPAYLLLVAGAVDWLLRRRWPLDLAGLAALAALLALAWAPLRDVVYSAEPQKEDWAGAYRFIDARARNGDVVLVHPGYLRTTADYYRRRLPGLAALPVVTLPSLNTAGFGERELDAALAELTWGKTRVWLVTSPERLAADDPRGLLRRWYEGNTLRFADQRFNGVRVETFSYNGPLKAGLWRPELPLRVDFDGEISLLGATWDGLGEGGAVRAGDWALLTLRWRALRPLTTAYVVRVRLRDAAGREAAAYDIAPLDGHYPTDRWGREQVWDYHDLPIPADLPPGRYTVIVGLYPTGRPAEGLRPSSDAAPGDPLGVAVGTLAVSR
jgi:mannosyltransferase